MTQFGMAEPTGQAWRAFANALSFATAGPTRAQPLLDAVAATEQAIGGHPRRLFHLAVPPAGFAPTVGMLGDTGLMIVTHLFQVLGFVAMEPPTALAAKPLRDEKTKVFEAMPPLDPSAVVRGQYHGYRDEPGVDPGSQTETFVAARVEVDNWRWSGTPFYLRSGKSLGQRRQVVTLGFKEPPLRMFALDPDTRRAKPSNKLVIDFDDRGWIAAHFLAKEPGATTRLGGATMTFRYADSFGNLHGLRGYERPILDAMLGDQSLFTRADGIERLWEVSAPLPDDPPPVQLYDPGSWGPDAIRRLIAPHHWYLPDTPPNPP